MSATSTQAGFIAFIGAPNAGKSSLVNRLVGSKVSIVTQKVQTTRFQVRGIAIRATAQAVLVDTPGLFKPRRRLDRAMVQAAWSGAQDADAILHLVDAASEIAVAKKAATAGDHHAAEDTAAVTKGLKDAGLKATLVINKVDLVRREDLLGLAQALFDETVYDQVFMISAHNGSGVEDLAAALFAKLPEGPWLYPEDQLADAPMRILAAEITREKLFLRVHEELPYAAAVETTQFEERRDGSVRIEQTIYVERDGQKPIVIGEGGKTLKHIGQKSREELETIMDRKVHLFLHVKVDPRWTEDRSHYDQYGLEFGS